MRALKAREGVAGTKRKQPITRRSCRNRRVKEAFVAGEKDRRLEGVSYGDRLVVGMELGGKERSDSLPSLAFRGIRHQHPTVKDHRFRQESLLDTAVPRQVS